MKYYREETKQKKNIYLKKYINKKSGQWHIDQESGLMFETLKNGFFLRVKMSRTRTAVNRFYSFKFYIIDHRRRDFLTFNNCIKLRSIN